MDQFRLLNGTYCPPYPKIELNVSDVFPFSNSFYSIYIVKENPRLDRVVVNGLMTGCSMQT